MTKKVKEPRKEAELTLSFAKKSGADLIKSTKKLTGYRLPSSLVVYVINEQSDESELTLVVTPTIKPETLKKIPNVAEVKETLFHHSSMTGLPMEKHTGTQEITFGRQIKVKGVENLTAFLHNLNQLLPK